MQSEENKQFTAATTAELTKVAEHLLKAFPGIHIYALNGDLGSGKTALVKAICTYAEVADDVSSPTFGIVNEYFSQKLNKKIFHFDLYRLNSENDLLQIGFEEYLHEDNALIFIEWPELAKHFLELPYMEIDVDPQPDGSRIFNCKIIKK